MAKFTQTQAENCKTVKAKKATEDGVHYYSFVVRDNNGFVYKWIDTALAPDATKATKKTAMYRYLKTIDKHLAKRPIVVEDDKHKLVGKRIKDA